MKNLDEKCSKCGIKRMNYKKPIDIYDPKTWWHQTRDDKLLCPDCKKRRKRNRR